MIQDQYLMLDKRIFDLDAKIQNLAQAYLTQTRMVEKDIAAMKESLVHVMKTLDEVENFLAEEADVSAESSESDESSDSIQKKKSIQQRR